MGLKEAGLRGSLRSVSTGVSAIPDSEVNNYLVSNFTTSVWEDGVGSADLNDIVGASIDSSAFDGSGGVDADGVDDYANGSPPDLNWDNDTWSLSIPFNTADSGGEGLAVLDSTIDSWIRLYPNGASFEGDIDNFGIYFEDPNGNGLKFDTATSYGDGNDHHAIITNNTSPPTASSISIFVDDMATDVATNTQDQSPSNYGTPAEQTIFDLNSTGVRNMDMAVSDIRWFNNALSESERVAVQDALPFDV